MDRDTYNAGWEECEKYLLGQKRFDTLVKLLTAYRDEFDCSKKLAHPPQDMDTLIVDLVSEVENTGATIAHNPNAICRKCDEPRKDCVCDENEQK